MADGSTEFKLAPVDSAAGPVALVTIDNGLDHAHPTVFGRDALASLERLLPQLEGGDWAGALITGKPFFFSAGADLEEFPRLRTRAEVVAASRVGHELFGRLRALPFPTLAAVNGACLGGGVELALHCRLRTISTAVRHFAMPECFLGIVPAWGGTQLLPRLVGAEAAVKLIVSNPLRQNRRLTGAQALEVGFADRLLEPAEFVDDSLAFLVDRMGDGAANGVRHPDMPRTDDVGEIVRRARAQLDDQVHGAAPAPYRALDLIEGAAGWTVEEGYRQEEEALADLLLGHEAQASLYAFELVERRAKRSPGRPSAEPGPVRKVGIVGAGLMATQLASLFVRRLEVPVVLRDLEQARVDEALAGVRGELEANRGRYAEGKARFLGSLVTGSTSYDGFQDCDLVLEAVFEDLALKREVLREVEQLVRPDTLLATNTSALSVTEMAAALDQPDRMLGMLFFNPVAVMPLVELVHTAQTSDDSLATAWRVAETLRKSPVLVRDAPGFVVNRVLMRMTQVLLRALENGNTVDETDEAVLRLGLPMAPSVLLQMVGPQVAKDVLETMHLAYPDRFWPSPALTSYASGSDELEPLRDERRDVEEITTDVLEAMAQEIFLLLEEGVVAEAADVDTCLLLGAGFPFFLGGITRHLDQVGISEGTVGRPLAEVRAAARMRVS